MPAFVTRNWLNGRENGINARWNAANANDLETRIATAVGSGVGGGGSGLTVVNAGIAVSNQTLDMTPYTEVLWVLTLGAPIKSEIIGWSAGKAVTQVIKQDSTGGWGCVLPTALWEDGVFPTAATDPNAKAIRTYFSDGVSVYGNDAGTGMA